MAKQAELVPTKERGLEKATATDMLGIIQQAVANPDLDVDKMERLLAMYERVTEREARKSFNESLARIQAQMPHITAEQEIRTSPQKGNKLISKYANYEAIDAILRPMLTEEGFSLSFNNESSNAQVFKVTATLRHRDGHEDSMSFVVPYDKSDFRSPVQNVASSHSFAKRQLVKSWFNVVESGDDPADAEALKPITEDEARDLRALADEIAADHVTVLEYAGAESYETILRRDYPRVLDALSKRKAEKGQR